MTRKSARHDETNESVSWRPWGATWGCARSGASVASARRCAGSSSTSRTTRSSACAATQIIRCRMGIRARRAGRCHRCTTILIASSSRSCRSTARCNRCRGMRASTISAPVSGRSSTSTVRRPSGCSSAAATVWTRPGTGWPRRLHGAIGTPAKFSPLTIDGTAKVLISDLVGGSAALSARPDYDEASFVMYFGSNPVVSHGHSVAIPDPVSFIRELRQHAEVWVVDPRSSETARLATHHLAPRPGTDYVVLAFLVREMLRRGADHDTVAHRVSDVDALGGRSRAVRSRRRGPDRGRASPKSSRSCSMRCAAPDGWPSRPGPASRWRPAPT